VNKNKKNFLLENNISKNYYNNNFYLKNKKKLNKIIKNIQNNLDYKKDIFHIFSKKFTLDFKKLQLSKFIKYKTVIIIGMGGSTLGAQSIYSLLEKNINRKFIFLDNLDQSKIEEMKKKINLKNSLFIIISKSGNTMETLINSNLFKDKISSKNSIIITEQKKSLLNIFAKKNNILQIAHKDYIGGRYSVLSEVGMVPAYFMGLKINNFRKNLLSFFKLTKLLQFCQCLLCAY
jgi:glucose-6-phosphate isomerase